MTDTKGTAGTIRDGWAYLVRLGLIGLLSLAVLCSCLMNKVELHNDEYTSYIIANNSGEGGMQFAPQDLFLSDDPAQPYLAAMAVAPGQGFRYDTVVNNDASDTLPPLYYMLLHTVSSFFPGRFSIWFGGAVNMLFQALSIWLLSRLTGLLGMKDGPRLLCCLCFALLPGVVEIAQFLRMYSMSMFWVLLLSYEELKWLKSGVYGVKQAVAVGLSVMAGVLTHYYFILFALFQCLTIGAYLLVSRRWKTVGWYALTFAVAAGVTIAVYPGILRQVFDGWLTPTSIENLTAGEGLMERFKGFYFIINTRLFGGYLLPFAVAALIAALLLPPFRGLSGLSVAGFFQKHISWAVILLPCALYFLLITKIAFFTNTRYMCFLYPLMIVLAVETLTRLLAACPEGGRFARGLTALCVALALIGANQLYPMRIREYSGYESWWLIQRFEEHADLPAVCVYESTWQAENTYNLNKSVSGLVFVKRDRLAGLLECLPAADKGLLVEIETSMDAPAVLDELKALYPGLTATEELGDCSFFHTYLLH